MQNTHRKFSRLSYLSWLFSTVVVETVREGSALPVAKQGWIWQGLKVADLFCFSCLDSLLCQFSFHVSFFYFLDHNAMSRVCGSRSISGLLCEIKIITAKMGDIWMCQCSSMLICGTFNCCSLQSPGPKASSGMCSVHSDWGCLWSENFQLNASQSFPEANVLASSILHKWHYNKYCGPWNVHVFQIFHSLG